jgi:hypothetical protein
VLNVDTILKNCLYHGTWYYLGTTAVVGSTNFFIEFFNLLNNSRSYYVLASTVKFLKSYQNCLRSEDRQARVNANATCVDIRGRADRTRHIPISSDFTRISDTAVDLLLVLSVRI